MSKAQLTIYRINPLNDMTFLNFSQKLISEFNESYAGARLRKKYLKKPIARPINFTNLDEIYFYIGVQETEPSWKDFVGSLMGKDQKVINKSYSWILFMKKENIYYSITSGSAHNLISGYIDIIFGIEIFSKISDLHQKSIRSVTDKTLYGNRFSGTSYFLKDIALSDEKRMNAYFKEVSSSVQNEDVLSYLGLRGRNGNDTTTIVAKDSLKVKKAIDRNELNTLIGKLSDLLNLPDYDSINDFSVVTRRSILFQELNDKLWIGFNNWGQGDEDEDISISLPITFYRCEKIKIVFGGHILKEEITIDEVGSFIREHANLIIQEIDGDKIIEYFKKVSIIAIENNEDIDKVMLTSILDYKVLINRKFFYFMEGQWIHFKENFVDRLNRVLKEKVESIENQNTVEIPLKDWGHVNEGVYNLNHIGINNVAVMDKVLVDNIEICDLLWVDNNEIYFIHVKEGLAGSTRILCEQIEAAVSAVINSKLVSDSDVMERYYNSAKEKINTNTMSAQGHKFVNLFPEYEVFKEAIDKKNLNFVFAYKNTVNILETENIPSTPAKLAINGLLDNIKNYPVKLVFKQIEEE
ncbi:DUF6119 family protein [Planococcus sp. S3-L1]|uniref:DUF6119 family protein n=1 Tax=Planococcus sp. S3-L1 TaxID=3046200 RepID=UPI0024B8B45A|nr:DUF6119 family protein [Planococcus sp. S3-L1]MDJ0331783.1 TIGR04141 family sporadically distributed protein [Planococcus sp. S3-L1]